MATYVLTYNPARWFWDPADRARDVRETSRGEVVAGTWSTGGRRSGIQPGDTAVLFQQGTGERGLIAYGEFTSQVFRDRHWDGSGRDANYASVNWRSVLPEADIIPIAHVMTVAPSAQWNHMQGSGTVLPEEASKPVLGLFNSAPGPTAKPRVATGQGRQQDAARRKAVEDYAQALLEAEYRKDGWRVEDVRFTKPYDAVATKGRETVYLEAKGTETDGRSVLVTRGEVSWARKHAGHCVIGIVSGVVFDGPISVCPGSGSLATYIWDPDTGRLTPETYKWQPN